MAINSNNITLANETTMPPIGLGTWRFDDSSKTVRSIVEAINIGYRMIDTAALYGNETAVGKAIKQSAVPRDQLFVVTKLQMDDMGFASAIKAYQASLDRLDLDYADLYLIHSPTASTEPFVQSWRALEKLYRDDRVRAIGVSNFWPAQLSILHERGLTTPHVNQIHLHPYLQQRATQTYCQTNNIAIQSYSPLMRAGEVLDDPVITRLASRYNRTAAQIILRWHIEKGLVPLPKSSNQTRQAENLAALEFTLSAKDMQLIDDLDKQPKPTDS